ncbi:hypothetical protein HYS11_00655 [Candidatus Gottesmanbacteria bacterium]|nr:hypothetical protein [Candidatus Gottesmanbacteria bacterium]
MANKELEVDGSFRSDVIDPLEGIVEGNNRQERYVNFRCNVMSRIWPADPTSGEYGDDLHRTSRWNSGMDQNKPPFVPGPIDVQEITQTQISGYTQFSPHAIDPINLGPTHFEIMVHNLGTPDYVRVISIPPQLVREPVKIIPVGGSCVVETKGMHLLTPVRLAVAEGKCSGEALANYARKLVEFAPTITHVSGAILSGQNYSVHLVESDMWANRLHNDFGIPLEEAEQMTKRAYERIDRAIERKAKLINGNAKFVHVNFDELDLQQAINRWLTRLQISYDSDHRVFEVVYTYIGPEQHKLLHDALKLRLANPQLPEDERPAIQFLLDASSYHVRLKQQDHLRWGSMNLPKDVIIGQRNLSDEERMQATTDYSYHVGITISKDRWDRYQSGEQISELVVGFTDIPGDGNTVQHQTLNHANKFKGKPGETTFEESVQHLFETSTWLHRGNIGDHLSYLESFTVDVANDRAKLIEQKRVNRLAHSDIVKKRNDVEKVAKENASKLNKLRKREREESDTVQTLIQMQKLVDMPLSCELRNGIINLKTKLVKNKGAIEQRIAEENETPEDKSDLAGISVVIPFLLETEEGNGPLPSSEIISYLFKLQKDSEGRLATIAESMKVARLNLEQGERDLTEFDKKNRQTLDTLNGEVAKINEQIQALGSRNYFPLSDNPFVQHAMWLLADKDFVKFMLETVRIQEFLISDRQVILDRQLALKDVCESSQQAGDVVNANMSQLDIQRKLKELDNEEKRLRAEANSRMQKLCAGIYPKLEAYIRFVYDL